MRSRRTTTKEPKGKEKPKTDDTWKRHKEEKEGPDPGKSRGAGWKAQGRGYPWERRGHLLF